MDDEGLGFGKSPLCFFQDEVDEVDEVEGWLFGLMDSTPFRVD